MLGLGQYRVTQLPMWDVKVAINLLYMIPLTTPFYLSLMHNFGVIVCCLTPGQHCMSKCCPSYYRSCRQPVIHGSRAVALYVSLIDSYFVGVMYPVL